MTTGSKLILDSNAVWSAIKRGVKVIDVRTESEFLQGHLPGAINISHDQILARVNELELNPEEDIVLYCKSGGRSDFAMKILQGMGYSKAINAGGYEELVKASESSDSKE